MTQITAAGPLVVAAALPPTPRTYGGGGPPPFGAAEARAQPPLLSLATRGPLYHTARSLGYCDIRDAGACALADVLGAPTAPPRLTALGLERQPLLARRACAAAVRHVGRASAENADVESKDGADVDENSSNDSSSDSPRLASPRLASPHLASPRLTSPRLDSTRFGGRRLSVVDRRSSIVDRRSVGRHPPPPSRHRRLSAPPPRRSTTASPPRLLVLSSLSSSLTTRARARLRHPPRPPVRLDDGALRTRGSRRPFLATPLPHTKWRVLALTTSTLATNDRARSSTKRHRRC